MIKLAVFDVDGTLITRGNRVLLDSTIKALHALSNQGIKLAIASGRPPFAMEKSILENIDFDYFICSNGAYVKHHDGRVLHHFEIKHEETLDLIHKCRETDNALMFQCQDGAPCYHGYKRIAHMLQGFLGRLDILYDERESVTFTRDSLPLAAVAKISDEDLHAFKKTFPQFTFTPFERYYYDINGQHNKASGITHICKELNCNMQDVMAFGDEMNDYDMIQKSGYGIAMGNGNDRIKEIANYITDSCDEDGIAKACAYYGLL